MLASSMGWSEHFILWELPLARANQYVHAIIRYESATQEVEWTEAGMPT